MRNLFSHIGQLCDMLRWFSQQRFALHRKCSSSSDTDTDTDTDTDADIEAWQENCSRGAADPGPRQPDFLVALVAFAPPPLRTLRRPATELPLRPSV